MLVQNPHTPPPPRTKIIQDCRCTLSSLGFHSTHPFVAWFYHLWECKGYFLCTIILMKYLYTPAPPPCPMLIVCVCRWWGCPVKVTVAMVSVHCTTGLLHECRMCMGPARPRWGNSRCLMRGDVSVVCVSLFDNSVVYVCITPRGVLFDTVVSSLLSLAGMRLCKPPWETRAECCSCFFKFSLLLFIYFRNSRGV